MDKNANPEILDEIREALQNAGKLTFWKKQCLVQSLAGKWMLQRKGIPSVISFGVKLDKSNKLAAHSWLKVDSFEIIEKGTDFKELLSC